MLLTLLQATAQASNTASKIKEMFEFQLLFNVSIIGLTNSDFNN